MGADVTFELKGVGFIGMLRSVEKAHGLATRDAVVAALPGDVGQAVRSGSLIASGWYPAEWYAAIADTVVRIVGGGSETIRALSQTAVMDDLATIFKILSLVLSPERTLQTAIKVTSRYMRGGTLDVVESTSGRVRLRADGHHGFNALLWWDFVGGAEGVLLSMKVANLRSRIVRGGRDGDDWAEILLEWDVTR